MDNRLVGQQPEWRREDLELIQLVSIGLGNKEIASRSGISETAVKKRLSALMRRCRVANRAALVRTAFEAGLLQHIEAQRTKRH
jgi:DNA-binding NarL/FixJ family response regulator